MGYRDDEEGLRMRVAELEGELDEANDTIARLRGEGATPLAKEGKGNDWVTGGPRKLAVERELPFEVTDEGFEAIAEVAAQRLPGGSVSLVGRTLTYRHGQLTLRVTRGEGKTRLVAQANYQGARLLFALGGMGVAILGGGLVVGVAEPLALSGALLVPLFVLGGLLGVLGLRHLMKKGNAKGQETLTGLFETACDLVKEHHHEPPKARVVLDEADAEREALASEEAAIAEAEAVEDQSSPRAS